MILGSITASCMTYIVCTDDKTSDVGVFADNMNNNNIIFSSASIQLDKNLFNVLDKIARLQEHVNFKKCLHNNDNTYETVIIL